MMHKIFESTDLLLFFQITFSFFLYFFVIKSNILKNYLKNIEHSEYYGVQKIHKKFTPRLGGVILYLSLITYNLTSYNQSGEFFNCLLISSLPLIILSLKEDIYHNVSPKKRLFGILLSALIFFILYDDLKLPNIQFPLIDILLENYYLAILFFIFAILSVSNGFNIIDGSNGTCAFISLSQLISLSLISYYEGDTLILQCTLILGFYLLVFLFFNYPFGKIFLGDSGAYFLGFSISIMTILLYGRNNELPTWGAILILFYPIVEMIFSTIRKKIFEGTSPFKPDPHHLHLKIYFNLNKINKKSKFFISPNNLMIFTLAPIWLLPQIIIANYYKSLFLIIWGIIISVIVYLVFYFIVPRKI